MSRPRDSQRQKLYASERAVLHNQPKKEAWALWECQNYVDDVCEKPWFRKRWGLRKIDVEPGRGGAHGGNGIITLGVWARQPTVILHEMAHCLQRRDTAAHGPEYAGIYLTLIGYMEGQETRKLLRESMRKHKVKVSMKGVPPPTRKHRTVSAMAALKREEQKKPVEKYRSQDAAKIIRDAVKAGQFGPSGRKPRVHALEVARALEEF